MELWNLIIVSNLEENLLLHVQETQQWNFFCKLANAYERPHKIYLNN